MAAFTDDEIAQIFDIFGLPRQGTGIIAPELVARPTALSATWDASYNSASIAGIVTALETQLAASTEEQRTRARLHLTRWTEIGGSSPLEIRQGSDGSAGLLASYPKERENIRQALACILGIMVPEGGFFAEARRVFFGTGRGDR